MNEPIISPWFIYAINIVDKLIGIFGFVMVVSLIGAIVSTASAFDPMDIGCPENAKWMKFAKKLYAVFVVTFVLVTFIPNSKTCWQMAVASHVTMENINATGQVTADVAQKALDMITDSVVKIVREVKNDNS